MLANGRLGHDPLLRQAARLRPNPRELAYIRGSIGQLDGIDEVLLEENQRIERAER